jgi:hypothetical protein
VVAVWSEKDRQDAAADRPRGEAADAQVATRGHKQHRKTDGADCATDLGHPRAHATTTEHFAAWSPATMYSR